MQIYLVRHGDAVPEEDAGSDRDRWLSAKGREHARILGRLLREEKCEPDAVQTAELLAQALDYLGIVTSLRCLEPSAHPRVAANEIMARGQAVIAVSHEPMLSNLGAFLMGRPAFPQFRTGQCCVLEDGKPTFTARADLGQIQPFLVD